MTMKQLIVLSASVLLIAAATNTIAGKKCARAEGNMIVGKVTMDCLDVKGSAKFNQTTIKGALHINGPLTAKSSSLNRINIVGNTVLHDSTVSGLANVTGSLEASDTAFKDNIQASSQSVTLNHSTVRNIKIKSDKPHQITYVYLNDNSVVSGNITFVGGKGVVKNQRSKVLGKIIGGKILE